MLDANANGVVVSGLSGREDTRVYAKPLEMERSAHTLSDEEIQAIARAIESQHQVFKGKQESSTSNGTDCRKLDSYDEYTRDVYVC